MSQGHFKWKENVTGPPESQATSLWSLRPHGPRESSHCARPAAVRRHLLWTGSGPPDTVPACHLRCPPRSSRGVPVRCLSPACSTGLAVYWEFPRHTSIHTQNESAPLRGRSVGVNAQQRQEPAGAGGEQSARAGAWSQTLRAGGVCRLQGGGQAVRAPGPGGGRVRICAAARVLPAQGSLPGGPGVQGLGLPCCGTVRPRPAGDGRSSRYPESKAARAGRKGRRPCGASVPRTPPRFRRARDSAPTPSTEQGLAPCSPARRCPSQPAPPTSSPPHTLPALGAHRIKSPGGWGFHPHQRQPRRVTLTWP